MDMDRALSAGAGGPTAAEDCRYKPIKTCEQLKECDKGQSPIEFYGDIKSVAGPNFGATGGWKFTKTDLENIASESAVGGDYV